MRLLLSCLSVASLLASAAANADDAAVDVFTFAGCTLSGPCKLTADEQGSMIDEKSGGRLGLKIHLSAPTSRGFTAWVDAVGRPYLIDFSGPPDSRQPLTAGESADQCAPEVMRFGSIRRLSPPVPGFLGYGRLNYFIVLADEMTPEHRSESLQAIDRWISNTDVQPLLTAGSSFMDDPEDTSIFELDPLVGISAQVKAAQRLLGPHFRGAIVACGWNGDISPRTVWQTRLLDLPLATAVSGSTPD